ncbi:hypothetical protein ES705_40992 [subsurface metagenome]
MEVKKVIEKAVEYLKKFFPNAERVQLEEVELSDDDKFWNITLSYEDLEPSPGYITFGKKRFYKIFKIDTNNMEVRSMKIRDLK